MLNGKHFDLQVSASKKASCGTDHILAKMGMIDLIKNQFSVRIVLVSSLTSSGVSQFYSRPSKGNAPFSLR